jgi:hypothetical protein
MLKSTPLRTNLVSLAAPFAWYPEPGQWSKVCAFGVTMRSRTSSRGLSAIGDFYFSPQKPLHRILHNAWNRAVLTAEGSEARYRLYPKAELFYAGVSQLADQKRNPLLYENQIATVSIISRGCFIEWIGRRMV